MSTKTRIVFVAGSASHGSGSHEHPAGCAFLGRSVERRCGRYRDSCTSGVGLQNPATFAGTDAIIVYSDGGRWTS